MNYYILFPGDTEADTINDQNHLGDDNGFGVFWAAGGFRLLQRLVKENHTDAFKYLSDKQKNIFAGWVQLIDESVTYK